MDFRRRALLAGSAALLVRPAIAQGTSQPNPRLIRFIPQADLTVLDPMWTTAYVTRNHGFMVFDTLFGMDSQYKPSPQMVAGFKTEEDGKRWTLGLRSGLRFHDGEPVRAQDCVASIARWAKRDAFGQALMAATDELSAKDDRTIVFRLNRPFPLLPAALGKTQTYVPVIMPERLANTDAGNAGHGDGRQRSVPFRRRRADGGRAGGLCAVQGIRATAGRHADMTAGPKVVNVDRVEWTTIPDPTTAAQALINGEQDWWDYASADLVGLLQKSRGVKAVVQEPSGQMSQIRFNQLQPPFNNPAIRRALLGAISQEDVVTAVAGTDPKLWHVPVGFFAPNSPMASKDGLDVFTAPRDVDRVKRDLAAAGYKGERVVLLAATDFPVLKAMSDVAADALKRCGMNVDYVATDWGTVVTRRASKEPVSKGGWSAFCTAWAGADQINPAGHISLRANGDKAWFGWPDDPALETLRTQWFQAPDVPAQAAICAQMQEEALRSVPYIPMGQYLQPTAYRSSLEGVLNGFAIFWNVRKS